MKKSKFTESQIIKALKENESGRVTIQPVYQSPQSKFDTNGSVWAVKSFFIASKAEYPCLVAVDKKALIR
ncbi:MAG: hypothetical protein NXI26_14935, partial [bacterium]|nr:hypothetical protein [bacterium]